MAALRHDAAAPETAPVAVIRVRTTVTLPRDLHQRLRIRAIEYGVSMEALAETAIVALLDGKGAR